MIEVPLANGRGVALVDEEDAPRVLLYRWCYLKGGYAVRRKDGRLALMHREILGLGRADGDEVDHINGNGLDNRRENLRIVGQAANLQNVRPHRDGSSRYRGVSWKASASLWEVRVYVNGKTHRGGYFHDEDEAGAKAAAMRAELMPYAVS